MSTEKLLFFLTITLVNPFKFYLIISSFNLSNKWNKLDLFYLYFSCVD